MRLACCSRKAPGYGRQYTPLAVLKIKDSGVTVGTQSFSYLFQYIRERGKSRTFLHSDNDDDNDDNNTIYFINPVNCGNLQTLPLQTFAPIEEHKQRTSSKDTKKYSLKSEERSWQRELSMIAHVYTSVPYISYLQSNRIRFLLLLKTPTATGTKERLSDCPKLKSSHSTTALNQSTIKRRPKRACLVL